jgi:hypothetical protein
MRPATEYVGAYLVARKAEWAEPDRRHVRGRGANGIGDRSKAARGLLLRQRSRCRRPDSGPPPDGASSRRER